MRTLVRWSILLPIMLLSANLHAQWTNVAPNLVPDAGFQGAMQYKNGIVWAGSSLLWSSKDMGKTWQQCLPFPKAVISDIVFFDNLHGAVSTEDQGIFTTKDGGLSWLQQLKGLNLVKVGYAGSSSIIFTLEIDGFFHISNDGGNTWQTIGLSGSLYHSFATAEDGTLYIDGSGAAIVSVDGGQTWNPTTGTYNSDCWTLAVDSCDSKRLYIANEQLQDTGAISNFYLSTDGGQTWQITDSKPKPYLSGSMSTTYDAVFLGTRDGSGIHRSMDQGLTWKAIGGPSLEYDSRNIALVNDNFIFAADSAGNIWMTTNGGGDSVAGSTFIEGTVSVAPGTLFDSVTLHCDSLVGTAYITITGCRPPGIDSIYITGPDAESFRILDDTTGDSVTILWTSQKPGQQNASLVVHLSTGADQTVSLSGFSATPRTGYSITPQSLFAGDTIYLGCNPNPSGKILIYDTACLWPNVTAEMILGDSNENYSIVRRTDTTIIDSAIVEIAFQPNDTGLCHASFVLSLNDGTTDTIPLSGVGRTTSALSIDESSTTQHTDTIGGNVSVPYTVLGLARPETIEVVLHYPMPDLAYLGSVDRFGNIVDMPGEQWAGRSKLMIVNDSPGKVTAYARFNVFSDTDYHPVLSWDSLDVPTALGPCAYELPPPVQDTIIPLEGCGIQMLSQWIHLDRTPVFRIQPNPTGDGLVELTSTSEVSDAWIEVYDMLGVNRMTIPVPILANVPVPLSLPLESGIYFLRIHSEGMVTNLNVVVNR